MLYIVSTPIGNLEDITLRAINTLRSVDFILVEDTRVTKILLDKYEIKKPMIVSPDVHSGPGRGTVDQIIKLLKDDKNLALVTDAGTPGVNDPGNFLIMNILEAMPDCRIIPVPGPNTAITALSISGFLSDRFVFLGFPPHKKGRQTFFKSIAEIGDTVVFYESKHRILKALENLKEFSDIGDRKVMIGRELTKKFETIYRGDLDSVLLQLHQDKILGEFVIVIDKI